MTWGILIFGPVGLGYWTYGRRQHDLLATLCAVCLWVFPSFIRPTSLMVAICVGIAAIPWATAWWVRR